MNPNAIAISLSAIFVTACPLLFAVIGETFAERSGVINLSVNGTIVLAAMSGFVAAELTNNLVLGYLMGMVVGGFIALIIAFSSISLHLSQVAVGYVLYYTTLDLAYFLGNPYSGLSGPTIPALPIPYLVKIPILGPLLFDADLLTYLSYLIFIVAWIYVYRTRPGLVLRGIGERPAAAFARGANVNKLRYIYVVLGGALAGLAGPIYSLGVKPGWQGQISGLDGFGWIVLAITIFGGWNPLRAAFGCYLFAFLEWLSIQQIFPPSIPGQVIAVAPFPLMILTLLFVNISDAEWVSRTLARLPERPRRIAVRILRALHAAPPGALGTPFTPE
jgi:ABC-type uncharacterized transport system permease subunit